MPGSAQDAQPPGAVVFDGLGCRVHHQRALPAEQILRGRGAAPAWLELLKAKGGAYNIQRRPDGQDEIFRGDTPVAIPQPGHFDYALRIRQMDAAGIDISIVSLTCPNVYWGDEATSCQAAVESNDAMARAQAQYPERIRWFTSLPWEYPERAVQELERTCANGAVGVMVLANISGRSLTDPFFEPVWAAIDRRGLPVLVHPTDPPGVDLMDMTKYDLSWSVGFMFDTTLAFTRMIFDGFFDRFPNMKLIASHGSGTLPYLVGRFAKGDEVEIPNAGACSASAGGTRSGCSGFDSACRSRTLQIFHAMENLQG